MGKFDEIFDDVVVNAKAAASAVSKKATGVYDSSKQKIAAAEIRSEINKKLRELGVLTYRVQKGITEDASEEIKVLVNEISDLKESLDTINQNLAAAKNQRKCQECNANVPKNSVFCNICGAKLDKADTDEFAKEENDSADGTVDETGSVSESTADIPEDDVVAYV